MQHPMPVSAYALWECSPQEADGRVTVRLDKRARGGMDYILLDPEWQLALGKGSGSLTCMQRVPAARELPVRL